MLKGERNRHVGETNMNERSSRSHTIIRVVVESRERKAGSEKGSRDSYSGAVKVSCLVSEFSMSRLVALETNGYLFLESRRFGWFRTCWSYWS